MFAVSVYPQLYDISGRNFHNKERKARLCVGFCDWKNILIIGDGRLVGADVWSIFDILFC